jgi:two-component system, NtrC family, response regulator AtoC
MSDIHFSPSLKKVNLKEIGRRAAREAEKAIIKVTLQHTHWNRKKAAELLQVSYKALLYKIKQYELDSDYS